MGTRTPKAPTTRLTPGALREHLGLCSGRTSYVIDRLANAGHVRRARDHPHGSRVVHVRDTEQGMGTVTTFFGPLDQRTQAVIDQFSPAEQDTSFRFIAGADESMNAHLIELESHAAARPSCACATRARATFALVRLHEFTAHLSHL